MSYPIDVVFVDRDHVVVGLVESVKPGKVSPIFWKAKACLELPAGTISDTATQVGDVLELG